MNETMDLQILVKDETPMFSQYMSDGSGALSKTYFQLLGRQQPQKVLARAFINGKEDFEFIILWQCSGF